MLEAKQVRYRYEEDRGLLQGDFYAKRGETVGIIGPNGSGKSTLLKLLSNQLQAEQGEVLLDGKPIETYSAKERARKIAVLSQEQLTDLPFTVEEIVRMGRYPHQDRWFYLSARDKEMVSCAMQSTETISFRHRWLQTLSGGERQRISIAKCYAQDPTYLLLDEPNSYLDLHYQWKLLKMLQQWRKDNERTLILVLHDINLAAIFCERIYLLSAGRVIVSGTPKEVIIKERLEEVYQTSLEVIQHPTYLVPQVLFG